jgi:AbrB family looped-hinge helix DNA binding protein
MLAVDKVLNYLPSYSKIRQEVEAMLKARVSSRGQVALPKEVRDQLGLGEGASLTVRVEGDEVILRKALTGNWREWEGRFKESDLLGDLARSRRKELAHDRKRS